VQVVKPTAPDEGPGSPAGDRPADPDSREESPWPEFLNYFFVLRQHIVLFMVVVCITGLAVLFLGMRQQKVYRAKATVLVAYSPPKVMGEGDDVYQMSHRLWEYQRYFETQPEVITSREVLQEAVDELDLAHDESFLGVDDMEPGEEKLDALAKADPVTLLRKRIEVEPLRDSLALSIYVRDIDPQRAADIANEVAEAYSHYYENQRTAATGVAGKWLRERVEQLELEVATAEGSVSQYRRDHDFIEAEGKALFDMGSEKIVALNEAAAEIEVDIVALNARWSRATRMVEDGNADAIPEVLHDETIQTLKQSMFEVAGEEAELLARYGDKMPRLKRTQAERAGLQLAIEQETQRILDSMAAELGSLRDARSQIERELIDERAEVQAIKEKEMDFHRLQRDLEQTEELYRQVNNRSLETDLAGMLEYSNISVLDKAILPDRPFEPRLQVVLMLALLMAIATGVGVIFLVDRLDSTVRSADQLEAEFRLPVLGIQPMFQPGEEEKEPEPGLRISREPRGSLAESCRSIRTNLMFMSPGQQMGTLLVTSAGPSEGKTSLSANLAYTMASAGKRTILVDTDMRRPRVHRVFGLERRGALAQALIGEVEFEAAVRPSGYANLDLMPLGSVPPNPAELLDSAAFMRMLEWLHTNYDRVIFDSPPAMAVTDASILAQYVDGVILVAREDKSNRHVMRQAVKALQTVNARILGFVLNDVDLERARKGYYSYRYKYRYPYYYYQYRYPSRYTEGTGEGEDEQTVG
jgi:polysaccharide biosynthesis transport protein